MINSTLCYLERGDAYLMLHRVKKKGDLNHDKWIGVGGKFEDGESPEDCAARELGEETGLVAQRLELVARAAGSPGFTSETTCVYLAHGLSPHAAHPDEGELVDVHWIPVRDVAEAIREGLICDSKTIIAAQAALIRGLA